MHNKDKCTFWKVPNVNDYVVHGEGSGFERRFRKKFESSNTSGRNLFGIQRLRLGEIPKGVDCWVNLAWICEHKTTGYIVNIEHGICSKG